MNSVVTGVNAGGAVALFSDQPTGKCEKKESGVEYSNKKNKKSTRYADLLAASRQQPFVCVIADKRLMVVLR